MTPAAFGVQAAGAGGDLPEEWQALLVTQASMLTALLSRMQTTAATMRRRQALAAEAERVLTAQAQEQVRLERELGELRALVMDFSTRPAALTAGVVESARQQSAERACMRYDTW